MYERKVVKSKVKSNYGGEEQYGNIQHYYMGEQGFHFMGNYATFSRGIMGLMLPKGHLHCQRAVDR